ncbi:hypothetical protein Pint_16653 [Pistacia integerrima]|uniref:Uncharacterized protein n=1 Tax=Pistacia integerrima TaxID=434235 RepID=A0ACC0ZDF5_9ROSI|nr:hypothetical protein Pint_16653 [Pistacia integerrima]
MGQQTWGWGKELGQRNSGQGYEEKRWSPKGETEPAAKPAETNHDINKFPEGVKGSVSRKPRALSLEDDITPPAMKVPKGKMFHTPSPYITSFVTL